MVQYSSMNVVFGVLACVHLILIFLSYSKIKNTKALLTFIYWWATPLGAFVWEDLLIFSIYNLLATLVVWAIGDIRIGLLFICIFWMIRSAGEAHYYFLQQFLRPKHHPHYVHEEFAPIRKIFGTISDQKIFIMMQVYQQSLAVFATVGLILLLKNWAKIPSSF